MLTPAKEQDRARIVAYLESEAHANLFMLADIQNFGFESDFQEVWTQEESGQLTGVALRYFMNFLYYAHRPGPHCREAADFFWRQNAQIVSAVPPLLDAMGEVPPGFARHDRLLCTLKQQNLLLPDPAGVQKATAEDAPELARQFGKIEEFKSLYVGGAQKLAQVIRNRIESGEGEHWYLRRGGEIVAQANTTAETAHNGVIGGVFTLPALRGQGLAGAVVSTVCRSLFARGKTPHLFYDNPEAGRIYHKLGFTPSGSWGSLEKEGDA